MSHDAYKVLWFDIVNKRSGQPGRLPLAIGFLNMGFWPAPIVRHFLGQQTQQEMMAAADTSDAGLKDEHVCEANLFGGELALVQADKDEAGRLFRLAAAGCPKALVEWTAANAELKLLGAGP